MKRSLLACLCLLTLCACTELQSPAAAPQADMSEKERNLNLLAEAAKNNGDVGMALKFYQEMADASTSSVKAHLTLAQMNRSMGRAKDSVTILHKAQALQPQNSSVLTELGFALIADDKPAEALPLLDTAIANAPTASAFNGRGIALDYLHRHEEARKAYDAALMLSPGNANIKNNQGLSHVFAGQYVEAVSLLEPLAQSDAANPTIRQNLALAYGLSGKTEQALTMALRDLPPEKAKENLEFYNHYRMLTPAVVPTATFQAVPVEPVASEDKPAEKPSNVAASKPEEVVKPLPPEIAETPPAPAEQKKAEAVSEEIPKEDIKAVMYQTVMGPMIPLEAPQPVAEITAAAPPQEPAEPAHVLPVAEEAAPEEKPVEIAAPLEDPAIPAQAELEPAAGGLTPVDLKPQDEGFAVDASDMELSPAEIRELIGEVIADGDDTAAQAQ